MAIIIPFQAIRYNREKIHDLASVLTPPFDIIDEEQQRLYYQRHPKNIIRLILGVDYPDDHNKDNKYTRAANYLETWQKEGVLIQDPRPSLYFYTQQYRIKHGTLKVRKGFVALIRLEEFGSGTVYPHEETFSKIKEDRFQLTMATGAYFNPIFSVYSCPEKSVDRLFYGICEKTPQIDLVADDGVVHKLWCVTDVEMIIKVAKEMEDMPVFIADGHHRYETALRVRDALSQNTPGYTGRESFNYVMMYFSNMDDDGLTVFPNHKLVFGLRDFDLKSFLHCLLDDFAIDVVPSRGRREVEVRETFWKALYSGSKKGIVIGLCSIGSEDFYILRLKDLSILDRELGEDVSPALKRLDVTTLHRLILKKRLGIGEKKLKEASHVRYLRDDDAAIDRVRRGDAQLAFLLNSVPIKDLRDVALSFARMPHKSTYFYPKLLSGLLINVIDSGEVHWGEGGQGPRGRKRGSGSSA